MDQVDNFKKDKGQYMMMVMVFELFLFHIVLVCRLEIYHESYKISLRSVSSEM